MCVHLCVYIPFVCGCEGASACLYVRDCVCASRCVCMHVRVCVFGVCIIHVRRGIIILCMNHMIILCMMCVHNVRLHECVCVASVYT